MADDRISMDAASHLILCLTPRDQIDQGVPVIVRGEGCRVFDPQGKSYIDLVAGVTRPVHLGYGRKELAQAAYDQMCEMAYFTPMGFANAPAMKLAQTLADITPDPINRFLFECSGSEAVESAMKLAKHFHCYNGEKGRFKVISRHGAYHGVNGAGARALGTVLPMRQIMEPLTPGGVFVDAPYCYRCPLNLTYPDCRVECARKIRDSIEFEGPDQISALIAEPVMQAYGALAPPPEYWPMLREICDQYGILLIADEVICGFGRTGRMFGIEHFDVRPDLMTMAKGITSGYVPLGAVGCSDRVMAPVEVVNHLHTYSNHPVSCAAALKAIEIYEHEQLVERSATMGQYFLEELKTLEQHTIVGEVRGVGLWTAIDFTADKHRRLPLSRNHLVSITTRARQKGLIVKLAPLGYALEFAPPLTISAEEIDAAVKILDECIAEEARMV